MLESCSYPTVPDYEEEVRRQRSLNVALFRKSLNTSKTKKKLENYAARFGHEFETVWYRVGNCCRGTWTNLDISEKQPSRHPPPPLSR